jgi:alkaline phosphatase D
VPQQAWEILESGRAYRGGHPPETIRLGGQDVPNLRKDAEPQSHLGTAQKAWFLDQLRRSRATWKIWGHSFGSLVWRTDMQNLPEGIVQAAWPTDDYGALNGGYFVERGEIYDLVRSEGIAGFAIVAGDKHSFWAGYVTKDLPPVGFDPVGVEFVTGSISSQGMFEVQELTMPATAPLRRLYLHDRPDGTKEPAINMTVRHGVRASLELARSHDVAAALALSNPDVAPHLTFTDLAGMGFATVRASADGLETEFVCIQRPLERSDRPDGGPLRYRVVHRVPRWGPGERPRMESALVEGTAPLGNPL